MKINPVYKAPNKIIKGVEAFENPLYVKPADKSQVRVQETVKRKNIFENIKTFFINILRSKAA